MNLDAPLTVELDADRGPDLARQQQASLKIIDGDIHPALRSPADLKPYLSARWWEHFQIYGGRRRSGMSYAP